MNILIPHSWLLEHLQTKAKPTEIEKYLSLSGPSVEAIYDKDGEPVYDIEVTTNRVDAMSVRGIAREAAVILSQFGLKSKLKPLKIEKPATPPTSQRLELPTVTTEDNYCRRVICVVLKNVRRTPTPDWMAKRLLEIDQNVHDSVIDITNYVTHELGHPIHAFDYDQIMNASSGHIIIKEARKGKKFETLDGNHYTTVGGEIVFENPDGEIIDLPAIKGTANTSINEHTSNVLLWIENLEPSKVRFASMTHAIRTVAAQLSEKNVDPHLAEAELYRAVELYVQLCQADVASKVYDDFPQKRRLDPVKISLERINEYLGLEIPLKTVTEILESLECEVELKKGVLYVTPPTFRPDLTIPADIVEEIARIYGYHLLPSKLMDTPIPQIKPEGVNFDYEERIKRFLANIGWQEVYTYSMVSEQLAHESGIPASKHLALANPLTDDRIYLRRSLVPSLEEVLDQNPLRKKLSVFEIANVYDPKEGELPEERLELALVSRLDYRLVRGAVEALLDQFFVDDVQVDGRSGALKADKVKIGEIAQTKNDNIAVTIQISKLWKVVKSHPNYQPIPKAESLLEDMTFEIPDGVAVGDVLTTIKESSDLINQVILKDEFHQNMTFSISYLDPKSDTSLSTSDIKPIREQIMMRVSKLQ